MCLNTQQAVSRRNGGSVANDADRGGHEIRQRDPSRDVSKMWSDTLRLLGRILEDLPSGHFGAIVRLCIAGIILLALIAIVDMFTIKRPELVLEIIILMFVFFMTSVILYVMHPPDDKQLASGQRRRMRQIDPQPITQPISR